MTETTDGNSLNGLSQALERVTRKVFVRDDNGMVQAQSFSRDDVTVEAPLQIILAWYNPQTHNYQNHPLLMAMRTPGNDQCLVVGILYGLNVITHYRDIADIHHLEHHVVEVTLTQGIMPDWQLLKRHSISYASCGVCGQQQVKQLAIRHPVVSDNSEKWLPFATVFELPQLLTTQQVNFAETGGVHGAGIWCEDDFVSISEDVGRHNAVDKVIGEQVITSSEQVSAVLKQAILVLSGRVSFELVQKAIVGNIPVIVAIGAPSSLAISLAKQFNLTLIGFTKANRCNVYCGEFRLI